MKKNTVNLALSLLLAIPACFGRPNRPDQIPNGSKFSCLNCHTGQGGPRNAFGSMVESGYLTAPGVNGNVVWGSALAAADADGDGSANGAELQDPAGAWRAGNPNPGNFSLVTNPGDSKSKPATSVETHNTGLPPRSLSLSRNYPNPFNSFTTIRFQAPYQDMVQVRIYDARGAVVWESEQSMDSPDEVKWIWDGNDMNRNPLGTGVYILTIRTSRETRSMRMLLLK